ncbi:hypothetical protein [Arthrobacter sp. FW306-06-A]|uniref:hypothetical protein n=1 Tax=Arthrobacter sp. FW306-06-A TaxID=2879621 RepID=UPI001F3D1FFB|nr:hypothetical protein [Arthrobacter sp. FW306-06-A]UKA71223.1 hypothetical protein LFT49_00220 [Arthrobacter sp. FW306-06-A]
MTENQWPQTPHTGADPAITDPYGATEVAPGQASYAAEGDTSKTQAAKDEASNVAGEAASAAQGVAQTAKSEAANVAQEAKSNAQDLLHQAKSGLTTQAGTQQQKAAEGIRNISSQLHSMASAPDQQGMASDLVRQAAERTSSAASWLENREPGDLLNEVQRFARNRPGTFLLLAAGAGVLAGRLTRGLTAGAPESQGQVQAGSAQGTGQYRAVQSPPVAPLHQETVYAAGTDDLFDEPVVGGAPVSTSTLPSGTAEESPLRFEDDPYRAENGVYTGEETFGSEGTSGSGRHQTGGL